jgi:hypothetical protein
MFEHVYYKLILKKEHIYTKKLVIERSGTNYCSRTLREVQAPQVSIDLLKLAP